MTTTWINREATRGLLLVALISVMVALLVHNPWVKAGLLAWEVLP
jgi:hypothetical protein